ncbi:MAG: FAD-dependent oxidoreductase, partial [Bacteroidaceae bacterium]|nr:FAD-dependent oxidoreductase [Bacteroidaceae bacterium]
RRMNLLEKEGIIFAMNTAVDIEHLPDGFDAYCFCTGAEQPRELDVPGRKLKGVHFALELLSQQNRILEGTEFSPEELISAKDKHVLVIGGGDTGSDCIGTSNRHKAASVTQIEIMPKPPVGKNAKTPWPEWPIVLKTTSSHAEGCVRRWNLCTKQLIGENGCVAGVEVEEVEWIAAENGARPQMHLTGRREVLKADLVLLAMGFLKDPSVELPANVFMAGDAANGASLVVRAMADARKVAQEIDAFLLPA